MEKDVNFNIISRFLKFVPNFLIWKYIKKAPKMDFTMIVFDTL
jgi:hypothetical protein